MTRRISRRETLAGLGAGLSAGCIGRTRNIAGRERPSQLVLEISTAPADDDPNGIRIARHLAENANAIGIDMRIETMGQMDLRRRVLLNHDFDLYVGQYLESDPFDPDALYPFTHSRFIPETGWQNPFGFGDLAVDDLLAEQRVAGDDRRPGAVAELQESLCELQPFTVVAFPDALTAIRDGGFTGWGGRQPLSVDGLLGLERQSVDDDEDQTEGDDGDQTGEDDATLELVTTDTRITENWNPIAPEYRRHGTFSSLLYDRLVRGDGDDAIPWLAERWEWIDSQTVEVTLRDARWHDGEPVRAADIAFTYEFLQDTSMGSVETPVPAPKYRGRSSLVESTTVVDDATVRLSLESASRHVGLRALQVPILPQHVWRERTEIATIAGFEVDGETTEAVVSNNEDPVGSGPIVLGEATGEESVTFERNPDHFLVRAGRSVDGGGDADGDIDSDPYEGIPDRFRGKPAFDRLVVDVVASDIAAVQAVGDGRADATITNLGPDSVPRIGREADARLVSAQSAAFYHVGYNARRSPLSNPRFRGVLAALIDKSVVIDDAFDGYAEAAASPLAASPEWVPETLRWDDDGTDPVHPFYGDDGTVDVEAARDALREAGYRFNDDGELLARDQ